MCDNLIFRLVRFSTVNSRTGKNIGKQMDVLDKCEFRIGGVGPSIGKQSKNHLQKKALQGERRVSGHIYHIT